MVATCKIVIECLDKYLVCMFSTEDSQGKLIALTEADGSKKLRKLPGTMEEEWQKHYIPQGLIGKLSLQLHCYRNPEKIYLKALSCHRQGGGLQ